MTGERVEQRTEAFNYKVSTLSFIPRDIISFFEQPGNLNI